MTSKQAARDGFLKIAYRSFAENGRKGLDFNQLSLRSGLSRGRCVHLFPNREQLMEAVFQKHRENILQLCQKIHVCPSYIPDLFQLLACYPAGIRFHRQLLLCQKDENAVRAYKEFSQLINSAVYPLWAGHVRFTGNPDDGENLHSTLMNMWLVYLDPGDLSTDALIRHAERIVRRLMWLGNGEGVFDTNV